MKTSCRTGSILLLCVAIVASLLAIAFAFARVAAQQHHGNDSENRALLAREAARMGLNHAVEQILREHTHIDATGAPSFNRMQGSTYAPFESFDRPFERDYDTDGAVTGGPVMVNAHDVPAENDLVHSYNSGFNEWQTMAFGMSTYDGRGRFYEPGFLNLAPTGFDSTLTAPTTGIRFGTPSLSDPLPQRSDGIFYDPHLRRMTGATVQEKRYNSRYRLRYAIGTIDLDGIILANGDQALDHRKLVYNSPLDIPAGVLASADGPAIQRMTRWRHALSQIVFASGLWGRDNSDGLGTMAKLTGGPRLEHIFMGRGLTTNFDLDRSAAARAPRSFPWMFRNGSIYDFGNSSASGPADALYLGDTTGAGGLAIPADQKLYNVLTGPQYSFTNLDTAANGAATDAGSAISLHRFSPFGRGMVVGANGRWNGKTDVPWVVNPFTSPLTVLYGMILGYVPPTALCCYYHEQVPPAYSAIVNPQDWEGQASYASPLLGGRDLFIPDMSPAFGFSASSTPYQAPPGGTSTTPLNFNLADARDRDHRYPGRLAHNGYHKKTSSSPSVWMNDNLGIYLRSTAKRNLVYNSGGEVDRTGRPSVVRYMTKDGVTPTQGREKDGNFDDHGRAGAGFQPMPKQDRNKFGMDAIGDFGNSNTRTNPGPSGSTPVPIPPEWDQHLYYPVNTIVKLSSPAPIPPATGYYRATVPNTNRRPSDGQCLPDAATASPAPIPYGPSPAPSPPQDKITCWTALTTDPSTPSGWDSAVYGAHPDSIWHPVITAAFAAINVARAQYQQYYNPNTFIDKPATLFDGGPYVGKRVKTIQDLDELFLANLGSSLQKPRDTVPCPAWNDADPNKRVTAWRAQYKYIGPLTYRFFPFPNVNSFSVASTPASGTSTASASDPPTPSWNLAKLRTATVSIRVVTHNGSIIPRTVRTASPPSIPLPEVDLGLPQVPEGDYTFPLMALNHPNEPRYDGSSESFSADERTSVMEMIINDARLSWFGSSPGYRDVRADGREFFRALDLNGDGRIHCSGFRSNSGATTREKDLHIDQYIDGSDVDSADGYARKEPDQYFSLSGAFFVGKSRFWRIMVRGEVWDNVLNTAVNCAQLESVLCIDPANDSKEWVSGATPDFGAGHYSTHILFQRWFFNSYRGFMPRQQQ